MPPHTQADDVHAPGADAINRIRNTLMSAVQPAADDDRATFHLMDPVDRSGLAAVGSLKAAAAILMQPDWCADDAAARPHLAESLRHRAFIDISKSKKGIPTIYMEESDMHALGLQGRRHSGVSRPENLGEVSIEGLPGSIYQITRGTFNAPRWYKELARPSNVRDFDLKKAFCSGVLARYPDLEPLRHWRNRPEDFARQCGLPLAVVKEFVSACAGSGKPMREAWMVRHGLAAVPDRLLQYRRAIATAQERDVTNFGPVLKAKLQKLGVAEKAMANRIFYIINTMEERVSINRAIDLIAPISEVLSYEHDGFCASSGGQFQDAEWERKVMALIGRDFAVKLYRSRAEILQELQEQHTFIPGAHFTEVDSMWREKELDQLKLVQLLKQGACPVVLAKVVVLDLRTSDGEHVLSRWKATPGPNGKYDYWHFEERRCGGLWVEKCHMEATPLIEELITKAVCRLLQCKLRNLPKAILTGGFSKSIAEKMGSELLDSKWHDRCDADDSLMQFECGTILNTVTMTTCRGTPDHFMTKCMGVAWPTEVFEELKAAEVGAGVTWKQCLEEALGHENGQMGPYANYPAGTDHQTKSQGY